ncbi:uncharacterized protein EDB93DRAFT_1243831 [Suillus bovinus]|uniref:uncharacterized protein n=1 Tax=Suillus bovinus TaxID=48563 RepID=UPI001B877B2E|nr:uncharacterized protein EDB93DRAFT_1243831 [Suillus bovinus]KAG2126377.1 hypothetical protein EDB93DRAFT_1243831 [Suillus bovinus]
MIGRNPIMIRYGPVATLSIIFAILAGISIFLTEVYLNANFKTQVNMDNSTLNIFGVSGSPGVSPITIISRLTLTTNTACIVHWSLVGACGHQYTGSSNNACIQNQFVNNVALYLNVNTSVNWNLTAPIGTFDSSVVQNPPPVTYIPGRRQLPAKEYDTVLSMDPFLPYTLQKQVSTLYYPFDQHSAYVSLLAIDTDSNQSLPISGVIGYGSMINWIGSSAFYPTTAGNEMFYALALTVERQKMVKAFALLLVVINWTLSVTILWMTVLVLCRANVNDSLILTSTTVLFALPQIRASMPDSPPFDISGYFMNVCLVSICTSVLLFSRLQYHYRPVVTTSVELMRSQGATFLMNRE